ncbi:thiamine diphosphokinase [Ilumatobacter nonamiensis]|uniref:thiamine diphosphokinase n=1 Tax=Ilumatobacter nonamiensis TaxID=467093 RepID=UPI0003498369|nr:thiamine diphosphokinase [Ilumatobacter nonamiensis]
MNEHIVIITGASPLDDHVLEAIPSSAILLAVDGGLDVALAAGLSPSGLIGDLDSVSDDGLSWAEAHATIARHPEDKDQTDTELALAFAANMQPDRLTLIGGGERLDHTIAALGALRAPTLTGIPVLDGWWNGQHLDVIHGPGRRELHLEVGSLVSLLAIGKTCHRVGVSGVRWPLDDHELQPVVGLGVSNEVTADDGIVPVTVSGGVLTVFDVPDPVHLDPSPTPTSPEA